MKSIVNNVDCLSECLEQTIEQALEEDTLTIHFGRRLSDAEYDEVTASIVDFLNKRWPNLCKGKIPS